MSTVTRFEALLRDCELLADYAGRHGLLADNNLSVAIANAESKKSEADLIGAEQQLLAALNETVRAIGSISFPRLRAAYAWSRKDASIWDRLRRIKHSITQAFITTVCAAIIVIAIPLTTYFSRITFSVNEMREIELSRYFEQLEDLRSSADTQRASAGWRDKLGALRQTDARIRATIALAVQS